MAWLLLILAGLLETGWAIGLKLSEGFSRPVVSLFTLLGIAASMLLLAQAARTIPIGTAYSVWVGIGAAGAVLLEIWLFGAPSNPWRWFFLALLLAAVVGLNLTASH